jgi:hypothetical protein
VATALFGGITATHHPALYVAGTALGILLAGLTTAAVSFLLCERTMRPVFAQALAGEMPSEQESSTILGTGRRLLVSWALGSGVALVAIAVAFLGRGTRAVTSSSGRCCFWSSRACSPAGRS